MTPEFGASAGMFYIDEQTIDYLKLTGRDAEQVALVENYARATGLWADSLSEAEYERVCRLLRLVNQLLHSLHYHLES